MTLQQLRYIIEIAQSGSISLAAQRLFITQPSLSKSVADLEKEMGITIFYRGSRGVMLSPDGVTKAKKAALKHLRQRYHGSALHRWRQAFSLVNRAARE